MAKGVFILGVTDNEDGYMIADEIEANLNEYEIIRIVHPLDTFEEEPIRYAKTLSMERGCPVGYIHTKGSVNKGKNQAGIRRMWYKELYLKDYFHFNGTNEVNTTFTGSGRQTFFNMFVADTEAWRLLDINPEVNDRYYWERLWRKSTAKINGLIADDINTKDDHFRMQNVINNIINKSNKCTH